MCLLCDNRIDEVHHIVPRAQFGKRTRHLRDDMRNLCGLCKPCHTDERNAHDEVVRIMRIMRDRFGCEYPEEKFRPWACDVPVL